MTGQCRCEKDVNDEWSLGMNDALHCTMTNSINRCDIGRTAPRDAEWNPVSPCLCVVCARHDGRLTTPSDHISHSEATPSRNRIPRSEYRGFSRH